VEKFRFNPSLDLIKLNHII